MQSTYIRPQRRKEAWNREEKAFVETSLAINLHIHPKLIADPSKTLKKFISFVNFCVFVAPFIEKTKKISRTKVHVDAINWLITLCVHAAAVNVVVRCINCCYAHQQFIVWAIVSSAQRWENDEHKHTDTAFIFKYYWTMHNEQNLSEKKNANKVPTNTVETNRRLLTWSPLITLRSIQVICR